MTSGLGRILGQGNEMEEDENATDSFSPETTETISLIWTACCTVAIRGAIPNSFKGALSFFVMFFILCTRFCDLPFLNRIGWCFVWQVS